MSLDAGSSKAEFRINTLGDLSLQDSSARPVKLRTRKGLLLLAFLAADPKRSWSREHLAAIFWGDRMDQQARNSLRGALSDIRSVVGDAAVLVDGGSLTVNPAVVASDTGHLRQLDQSGGDGGTEDFRSFYGGEFLQEFDGPEEAMDWVMSIRAECRDLAANILKRQIQAQNGRGDIETAIRSARDLLSLDPYSEDCHRTLMRLYASNGERSKAIAQFQNCRQMMQHELGVEPAPETKALADEIALRDSVAITGMHKLIEDAGHVVPQPPVQTDANGPGNAPSIAVMPFVNMSGDAEQDYFADGIAEDIVTDLSHVPNLSVAAISSTAALKGLANRPDQVARDLSVRYVLEGSVRKYEQNIRITTRLIDGRTNLQIWAARYDRELVRIFDLQSEISSSVVAALELHFSPAAASRAGARGTRNVEAHEYYLRGRAFLKEMTLQSVQLSKHSFERAIEIDPDYGPALAGLADSIAMLGFHYDADDALLQEAMSYCAKALALDPDLAEAHCALGRLLSLLRRFEEAEAEFQKALTQRPNLVEAHLYRALMYITSGAYADAYPSMQRAYELDDQDLHTGMMFLLCLKASGRKGAIPATAQHVLKVAKKRIALNPYDDRAVYVGAMALGYLGQKDEARRWANLAASFDVEDARTTYNIACLFAELDEADKALAFLRKTLRLCSSRHKIEWIRKFDPDFENIRRDPRFPSIFEEFGL
jgi:adenylate cyclase